MKKTAKPEEKKLQGKGVKAEPECYESTIVDVVIA